jgi:hypothetical protein
MMTAAQLHDARMLIPGAYELNAPPHRAAAPAGLVAAAPVQDVRDHSVATSHMVSAPGHPTTRLGYAAAILGDVALIIGIILGVPVVLGLAVQAIMAGAALILDAFGRV